MTFLFRFVHMYVGTEVTYKCQHFLLCESHEAYEGNGYLTITSSYIHMYVFVLHFNIIFWLLASLKTGFHFYHTTQEGS
jgi:hypothetical protein